MRKTRLSMNYCIVRECPNFKPRECKRGPPRFFGEVRPPHLPLKVCSVTNKFPRDMTTCPLDEEVKAVVGVNDEISR